MFSDETLFFMFYSSPRDAMQEVAAQELWNRNWRYHKDLRLWITKESGSTPSQKVPGHLGEQGQYTFWDPENWGKEHKELTVLYADLEEKPVPVFLPGAGLLQATAQPPAASQQGQLGGQAQLPTRASFQQMGIAGL
jgi:CCR4-NOT transcription complex subunit 2